MVNKDNKKNGYGLFESYKIEREDKKSYLCGQFKDDKNMDIIYITIQEVMMTRNMNFKMMFR